MLNFTHAFEKIKEVFQSSDCTSIVVSKDSPYVAERKEAYNKRKEKDRRNGIFDGVRK